MQLAVFAHDLRRVVARAVIHHQNFRVPVLFLHLAEKRMQRRPDADAFVIGGNDETVGQELIG